MQEKLNNINVIGSGARTVVMAHGFGCDQNMWRFLTPMFDRDHRIVLYDYTGSGKSDASQFSVEKYSSLDGYAQDLIEVCTSLNLESSLFVGHSVSAMIGLIASLKMPSLFDKLVMVCPSPCFLNVAPDYYGGFDRADLQELLAMMDKNYIGWANYLGPIVMGADNPPELSAELSGSFCSTDPVIAKTFARATFFADCRNLLPKVKHPALILQSREDALASLSIGDYVHANMPASRLEVVTAKGHCLHMTHPDEVAGLIRDFDGNAPA
jgi:sigma-B regulation protein RsbQ